MKNQKLWGGRFKSSSLSEVDQFNASVEFDQKLWPHDIAGSMAHAKMLAKQKIISQKEAKNIVQGLQTISKKIESGKFSWDLSKEDVHLNIESILTQLIGSAGEKLHTARSRNDQVATDLRLYCREKVKLLLQGLVWLQQAFAETAKKNVETLLPGYTHLQRAQPISLAHHLLAYFEMLQRDFSRLSDSLDRINVLPLGAGALAGTTFPIDRTFVAKELQFHDAAANSLDAVSDRDFVIELLADLSLIMMHLSRFAEEWILWSTHEFGFIQLPEQFCTGSSMMPQKMNPDILELIRGKTGRVYGSLVSLLTIMKGLPLTYNKDMQEDKEPLFDAVETVLASLQILAPMIRQTKFNAENMKKALSAGFVLATDVADYLVTRGIPFRQAHHIVGKMVSYCHKKGIELKELKMDELKKFDQAFEKSIYHWLDEQHAVDRRKSLGGTARSNVNQAVTQAKKIISKNQQLIAKLK